MGEPLAKRPKNNDEFPNLLSDVADDIKERIMELDAVQLELDTLSEKAAEEILQIEQVYNKKRIPHYEVRKGIIDKIPNFWQTAILNHHLLSTSIPEDQEELIASLVDLDVEEFEDIKTGYKLKFTFDSNPFFENDVIIKTYRLSTENPNSSTSQIDWKEGKQPTEREPTADSALTFLEWIAADLPPDSDEIAEVIKDDLFPNPLQYYIMPDMQDVTDEELDEFLGDDSDPKLNSGNDE